MLFRSVIGTPKTQITPVQSSGKVLAASTNSGASTPVCSDEKPTNSPDLFQIDSGGDWATLYFTPVSNADAYFISYSENASAEEHGAEVTLSREGVQHFKIEMLRPSTTYYFKVRAQHGCMPGDWSGIKSNSAKHLESIDLSNIEFKKPNIISKVEIDEVMSEKSNTSKTNSVIRKVKADVLRQEKQNLSSDYLYITALKGIFAIFVTFAGIMIFVLLYKRKGKEVVKAQP